MAENPITVRVEVIAYIALNRPEKRNAINQASVRFPKAIDRGRWRPNVRAILIYRGEAGVLGRH